MKTHEFVMHGHKIIERWLEVPLDFRTESDPRTITFFSREFVRRGGEDRPLLVYLQGGPGTKGMRPANPASGWMDWALDRYRVIRQHRKLASQCHLIYLTQCTNKSIILAITA